MQLVKKKTAPVSKSDVLVNGLVATKKTAMINNMGPSK
jgi:hypothetical protein